jgi:photosystem II stability/assembly factor-like uncharacterized protein
VLIMNSYFRLLTLAGLVGTTAVSSLGHPSQEVRTLVLRLDPVAASPKTTVGKEFATSTKFDAKTRTLRLHLKPGVSPADVVAKLRDRREVTEIREGRQVLFSTAKDFRSITAITRRIDHIEESRGRKEEKREGPRKFSLEDETEEAGTDYLKGLREYIKVRAYPFDRIDSRAYDRGADQVKRLRPAQIGVKKSTGAKTASAVPGIAGKWKFDGPNNLNTPYRTYFGLRPSSGRVSAIAYHPTNPNTIYVGAPRGGVLKSTDGGVNWTALGDAWSFTTVSTIAIDPKNPNTVYVGTGDYHGMLSAYTMGIMKSTDGGTTWVNLGRSNFGSVAVSGLTVDPNDPNVIIVTTGRGPDGTGRVWRSTNGGTSWASPINQSANWSGLTYTAEVGGTRTYYAVGGGNNLYRSTDRGATWTKLTAPGTSNDFALPDIAGSQVDAKVAYYMSTADQKIYKTTDSGATWTDTTNNHPGDFNWSQGFYDWYIACYKNGTKDHVVTGLIDVCESADGGATWQSIGVTYTDGAKTHNDQHSFAAHPTNPNEILIGNDGGLYRATGGPGKWTIAGLSNKLGITQFYNVVWHPTDKNKILGGTQDNASPVAKGDLTRWENVGGGDGGFNAINWANPNIQFCTVYDFSVQMTRDGWNTSTDISPNIGTDRSPFVTPIYQDPVNSRYLYGCTNYLWRYDITAGTWTPRLGNTQLSNGELIYAVSVAPSNGQVIYTGSDDGRIFVSRNGGANWRNINTASLPNRAIRSISVDPTNPNSILVGLSGTGSQHILQCLDTSAAAPVYTAKGGSGTNALPDVPLNVIERDPSKPATNWYVGNDLGVFATGDGGVTWQNASAPLGLPNTQVNSLFANPRTGQLSAGTFGRGIWSISLGEEAPTGPASFNIMTGSLVSGSLSSLLTDDANSLVVNSTKVNGLGQAGAAAIQFDIPGTGPLTNLSFQVSCSTSSTNATQQIFVKNWRTGAHELVKAWPGSTARATQTIRMSANVKDYMSASRKVEVVVRGLVPTRFGNATFQTRVDRASIEATAN